MRKKRAPAQPDLFTDLSPSDPAMEPTESQERPAPPPPVLVVRNAAQLVCVAPAGESTRRGPAMRSPTLIEGGALIAREGRIEWIGPTARLPRTPLGAVVLDATGKTVLPG